MELREQLPNPPYIMMKSVSNGIRSFIESPLTFPIREINIENAKHELKVTSNKDLTFCQ